MSTTKKVVIGVDGGGTKTLTVCVDKERKVVGQFISSSTNKNSVGDDAARQALQSGINGAIVAAGVTLDDVAGITVGMSGVDRPSDKEQVGAWIREVLPEPIPIAIHNDATAALSSGTGGKLHGIVVISGTGTISYGYNNEGQSARAGGWGPALGDCGSGYDIGFEVLKAVARAKDGIIPPTLLSKAVLDQLGLTKEDELITWAYKKNDEGWQRVANLGAIAHVCAKQGDAKALAIIEDAATALYLNIKAVAARLNLAAGADSPVGGVPLVMAGGSLDRDDSVLTDALVRILNKQLPGLAPARPSVVPAVGAALLSAHALD